MNIKHIFIAFAVMVAPVLIHAERQVSHARKGATLTLDLNWDTNNYGTIQWQQSANNGRTWTDIEGATASRYAVRVDQPKLLRAVVDGDPSCPQALIEREILPVNMGQRREDVGSDYVDLSVTVTGLQPSDIIEYGYAASWASLQRSCDLQERTKLGDTPQLQPDGRYLLHCTGLKPGTDYSIRPWFLTTSGSIIYGASLYVTTTSGIAWSSEDWKIETDELRPVIKVSGKLKGSAFGVTLTYPDGTTKSLNARILKNDNYAPGSFKGLQPGTDYTLTATATVDDKEYTITRTIRTWSDYSEFEVATDSPQTSHTIRWATPRVLTRLTPDNLQVEYPRMCRVDENTILFAYHGGTSDHWRNIYLRTSHDNGQTWGEPVTLFDSDNTTFGKNYWRIVNPEMTRLANGWILLSVVANAKQETNNNCLVLTTISKDGGKTWSDPITVGRGRTWEPQIVQLPNGELELLVSSEAKWWEPKANPVQQEIVSARSTDNGLTWTAFERASYKPGARDGMPVAVVQDGNRGVIFVIESVNGGVNPTFVHRKLDEKWDTTDWDSKNDDDRWQTNLPNGAGAPYCLKLPSGELLIMAHANQTGSAWQTSRPSVSITGPDGRNARLLGTPLTGISAIPNGTGAYYNSFFLKDNETVWLLVTKARYDGDKRLESSIEMLEGKIIER